MCGQTPSLGAALVAGCTSGGGGGILRALFLSSCKVAGDWGGVLLWRESEGGQGTDGAGPI